MRRKMGNEITVPIFASLEVKKSVDWFCVTQATINSIVAEFHNDLIKINAVVLLRKKRVQKAFKDSAPMNCAFCIKCKLYPHHHVIDHANH